jgi:hypothetical protein
MSRGCLGSSWGGSHTDCKENGGQGSWHRQGSLAWLRTQVDEGGDAVSVHQHGLLYVRARSCSTSQGVMAMNHTTGGQRQKKNTITQQPGLKTTPQGAGVWLRWNTCLALEGRGSNPGTTTTKTTLHRMSLLP